MTEPQTTPLWVPDAKRVADARITHFRDWLKHRKGLEFPDYQALWAWSVDPIEDYYAAVWEYFDILHSAPYKQVLDSHHMPGAKWFEGARLNLAEQVFRHHQDDPDTAAIISRSEIRPLETLSWRELRKQVASVAHGLRALGVGPGDRVVSYLPNVTEAIVAFLATASVGAIWSSCSPDMGTRSVLDRFRQIDPKLMFACDGYRYGGKDFDRMDVVRKLRDSLPTLEKVVLLPYLDPAAKLENAVPWAEMADKDVPMRFEQVAFDHPLWVVYSSGTTGMPKPIVHGQGGILVKGLADCAFHLDMGPGERHFWLTTTGWIMWNLQVEVLLAGATVCLYDGNPASPDLDVLWRFVEEAGITMFGAGAAYYQNCKKADLKPAQWVKTANLKTMGSTGSPLSEECFHWLVEQFPNAMIASVSGGTDVAAAYVGGCPIVPVYAGEIQARALGTAVYAMNENGEIVEDEVGELVVTKPMPSMPLYFWNDEGGKRYHDSYFDMFPGVWRHGDWIRFTPRGSAIIYGRSDTTINRHGIRIGTSEIYRVVEEFPEIKDSLVVDLEYLGRESWMPLFVVMADGAALSDDLAKRIRAAIRDNLSGRHVPNDIIVVPDVPRTLSGKKMELPIKKLLLGQPIERVANPDAMANPESIAAYQEFAAQRAAQLQS